MKQIDKSNCNKKSREESLSSLGLILGALSFSLMTVCVKGINNRIPIYELVFFRSLLSLIPTYIILQKRKVNILGKNIKLLLTRGILGTLALLSIFNSLAKLPLGFATIIQYTYPIFTTLFASIFISEKIKRNIVFSLILGWFGVLFILNPDLEQINFINLDINILIAFLGAIFTSLAYICVRFLSISEDPFVIIQYFPLTSLLITIPIVITNWITPNYREIILILGIGIFTQIGQIFLTYGLKHLQASKATSINYIQVLFATIFGLVIFKEKITYNYVIGSVLILLGTIMATAKMRTKEYNKNIFP
tara:strand:- start:7695 stop:8615 length:921 start_codon:yes stop_codon:yes gene_type:complete